MINKTALRVAAVALAAGVALTATACSSQASSDSKTSSEEANEVISPITVDITSLDGQTVDVDVDNVININAADVTAWTAEIADPAIAEFIPGTSEGDTADALKTNPGIKPLKIGTTKVTMTSTDGTTVTFTVNVKG
jgi:hypothetical protein